MKLFTKYLRPYFARMSAGLTIKTVGTLIELFIPYILSHILKNVVGSQSVQLIIFWGVMMILCALGANVCNIIANRMAAFVAREFSRHVRRDLFEKTMSLSASQTDHFTIPSLESRITSDTYNVHGFVGMMQRMGVRAPILLIGGVAITLIMDPFLALVMIATMPLIFVTVLFISKKGIPLYAKVQNSVDKMVRVVREDVQGIRVIKALSKGEYEHRRFDKVNRDLLSDEKRATLTMNISNPIMTLLMNAGIVGVISLAASRVANHRSDPETVIAFMQYFTQISMAMMAMTRMFVMYTKSSASARRIVEVLEAPEDLTIKSEQEYPRVKSDAHISFEHVNFSYKGVRNDLTDISFELPRGGSLGIIGATGSGKSTLVKLLLRFYDVDSGAIRINGRDVRTIPPEEFYPMFGTAMQNDFLYADTIEENIKFGRNLTHEQIVKATKIAQANDFIEAFPDKFEHMLAQHGTNVSGGQKQRILISRAVAGEPSILLLDDSSSALDYKTDANLRAALSEHMQDTTLVTVAQRVSSVKNCDLIIVLDEGAIIGIGKHDELLASCEEYREISESQMGGAFVE